MDNEKNVAVEEQDNTSTVAESTTITKIVTDSSGGNRKVSDYISTILTNIAALFKIKSLVTVMLTILFFILANKNNIEAKDVMTVFLIVIGFYFGTQQKKNEEV